MNDASIATPSPGSAPRPWSLACALVLAACVLDTGGLGSTSANVGGDESGTTGVGSTSRPASEATTAGQDDDPPAETGLDTTAAETAVDPTTGDDTSDTGNTCMMECPPGWQCVGGGCINPDEGEPCGAGCGPAAPFCGPDGLCHDGTTGDPCGDGQCMDPQLCGPANVCQAGSEGEPCAEPQDCSATAPLCTGGACHDGGDGDPCALDGDCAGLLCGPSGCQDGGEGDPCADASDCAGGNYCPYDDQCHDGNFGDPCTADEQCDDLLACVPWIGGEVCGIGV